jgi:DNA (cytosine-5)-methyltransferase 1
LTVSTKTIEHNRTSLKFADIRVGAGGFALGLVSAGFSAEVVADGDPVSLATIRANRSWPTRPADEDLARRLAMADLSLLVANVSSAGVSIASAPASRSYEGEYSEILDVVKQAMPRAVCLVNVASLMHRKFATLRSAIEDDLHTSGYQFSWRVIDSAQYGLPQARRRAVLIALKTGEFVRFNWPLPQPLSATVGDLLLPQMSSAGWKGAEAWARLAGGVAPTLVGGSKQHGGADLGPTRTKEVWYSLGVDPRGVADSPPTASDPIRTMPRLTLAMLAKLQGFPDEWTFTGGKTAVYRQIAGTFPPPTARALGLAIRACLEQ